MDPTPNRTRSSESGPEPGGPPAGLARGGGDRRRRESLRPPRRRRESLGRPRALVPRSLVPFARRRTRRGFESLPPRRTARAMKTPTPTPRPSAQSSPRSRDPRRPTRKTLARNRSGTISGSTAARLLAALQRRERSRPRRRGPGPRGRRGRTRGVEPRGGSFSSATAFSFWSDGPARRTPPPAGRFPATRGRPIPAVARPVPSSGSDPSFASASFRSAPPFSAEFRASASSASPRRSDVVFTASRRSFAAAARVARGSYSDARCSPRRRPSPPTSSGASTGPERSRAPRTLSARIRIRSRRTSPARASTTRATRTRPTGVPRREPPPRAGSAPSVSAAARGTTTPREAPDPLAPAPAPLPPRDPDPPPPPREKLPRLVARLDARLRLAGNVSSVRCDASSGRGLRSTSSAPSACSMRPSRVTAGSDPSSNRRSSARLRPGAHSRPPAASEAQSMRRRTETRRTPRARRERLHRRRAGRARAGMLRLFRVLRRGGDEKVGLTRRRRVDARGRERVGLKGTARRRRARPPRRARAAVDPASRNAAKRASTVSLGTGAERRGEGGHVRLADDGFPVAESPHERGHHRRDRGAQVRAHLRARGPRSEAS